MKSFKSNLAILMILSIFSVTVFTLAANPVNAQEVDQDRVIASICDDIKLLPGTDDDCRTETGVDDSVLDNILQTVFLAAGGLSVAFITVGGLRYVISEGNDQKIQQAKDTILYAIIGLVISMAGFTIVRFVLGNVL